MKRNDWDIKNLLLEKIKKEGGFVNAHSHFDRAYTINSKNLHLSCCSLKQKWSLVDELKRKSTENDFKKRIKMAVEKMIQSGVKICATFIDIDDLVKLKALKAAKKIKKEYQDKIKVLLISQTLKGILNKKTRFWFEKALDEIDIIGSLPLTDKPNQKKHLDLICRYAKITGKMIHVHVDQNNSPYERETELLAQETIKHGLEGKVMAIHAISPANFSPKKKRAVYSLMKQAGMGVICCPSAALSMKALPYKSYLHNSITPVPELLQAGITVALGTDNIADIYMPFADGDLWTELRILMEACRFYEIDELTKMATFNGLKVLGLE